MIEELPPVVQTKLRAVSKPIGERRIWIRELLATHGTLTTTEITEIIGDKIGLVGRMLGMMEEDLMVKPIEVHSKGAKGRGEFTWALRCHPAPSLRQQPEEMKERCPTCGALVRSIFDHVDGCPGEENDPCPSVGKPQ